MKIKQTFYFTAISRFLKDEFLLTLNRPLRILNSMNPSILRSYLRFNMFKFKTKEIWCSHQIFDKLSVRQIDNYKFYTELQSMKLNYIDLVSHEVQFRQVLRERLEILNFIKPGKNVLCLGARLGAEVRSFIDLGCFAIGIDLNPGQNNKYVVYGDFHDLQLPSHVVDIIYTNSIDHTLDLNTMLREMNRVLKFGGHIIVEADPGTEEGKRIKPDLWQTLSWKKIDTLVTSIEDFGFRIITRNRFEYPRKGEQLVFMTHDTERIDV